MTNLSFQSIEEGSLKLVDEQGNEYFLPATEDVFAAIRRVRTHAVTGHSSGHVRPKVIQAMIRSGMSAEDVAHDTGAPLTQIQQYEGPVLAERRHIAYTAGQCPVYSESGSRPLSEVVTERLEARDIEDQSWDAWRTDTGAWHVELRYPVGDSTSVASWEYRSGSVTALNEEARWLSDTGPSDSGPIPDYGSVFNVEADHTQRDTRDPQTETGRILESLRRRKNETQPIVQSVPDAPESQPDGAHSALSHPQDAHDDAVLAAPAPTQDDDQPSLLDEPGVSDYADEQNDEQPKKKGRSSVPSWDEIMFGKKD
ncbi:septation protein SepH [Brevibacterium paucivorans]|uniref:septation protein SepH n=1 Tax=Brevibacterium paucivorans TaxID=170994 RepID=UPI0015E0E431|nr:septation protein SepH [Brevibacterium paucivorans]